MSFLWRRLALLAIAVSAVLLTFSPAEAQGRRLALVVGNAHYQHLPELGTPGEDASRMAEALRRLGFEVTLLSDVSDGMFKAMLDVVAEQAKGADAVVFYYAGHAIQMNGENYLLPVEAAPDPANPAASAWAMRDVLGRLQSSGATALVFLDACRTNPLGAAVGGPDGLAPIDSAAGTFVAFATRPGQASYDKGDGPVSPFAQALLAHIETPGLSISDLMIRVRRDVEAATVGRQVPWDQSSLRESFQFRPVAAEPPPPPVPGEGGDAFAGLEILEPETVVAAASSAPLPGGSGDSVLRAAPNAEPSLPRVSSAPKTPAAAEPVAAAPGPAPDAGQGPEAAPPVKLEKLALAAVEGAAEAAAPAPAPAPAPKPGAGLHLAAAGPAALAVRPPAAPLAPQAGAAILAAYSPRDRERLAPVPEEAAPDGDEAVTGLPAPSGSVPAEADLPAAVQTELKRIGCYGMTVDGDWGNGSRTALRTYYKAKSQPAPEDLEPTEALWRQLSAEPEGICKQPVAAAPKPSTPRKPAASTHNTPSKPAAQKPAAQKPAAEAPAKKPAAKSGPRCKFMVVAIVCS